MGREIVQKTRVVQVDKEASQTRELLRRKKRDPSARFACSGQASVARLAQIPSAKLGAGSSLRKKRLLRMTIRLHHYKKSNPVRGTGPGAGWRFVNYCGVKFW
jgi:hypothetical protein